MLQDVHTTHQSKTILARIRIAFNSHHRHSPRTPQLCGSIDLIKLKHHCHWWGIKLSLYSSKEKQTLYVHNWQESVHNLPAAWKDIEERLPSKGAIDKMSQIQSTALVNAARLKQHECLLFHLESTERDAVAAECHVPLIMLQGVHCTAKKL